MVDESLGAEEGQRDDGSRLATCDPRQSQVAVGRLQTLIGQPAKRMCSVAQRSREGLAGWG